MPVSPRYDPNPDLDFDLDLYLALDLHDILDFINSRG
jgi:hypothetical protein